MKKTLVNAALLFSGIMLFMLPQPNFIRAEGFPLFAYIAFVPVFILTRRLSWKSVWLYGMLYGIGCYVTFTSWLATFHPMGITVISCLYVFPLLKAAWVLCGKRVWFAQWIVWCAYEYLKTKGFAGFNYGVTAYSHWRLTHLIQITNIVGVWGLSALIDFTSMWIADCIYPLFDCGKKVCAEKSAAELHPVFGKVREKMRIRRISACIWCAAFAFSLIYGIASVKDWSGHPSKKIILVQTDTDPWLGGTAAYRRDLTTLERLTDEALKAHPDAELVVWPETAFVPRIRWHYRYRTDRARFELVDELLHYIDSKNIPFVIGNDDTVRGYTRTGGLGEVSYNAVLFFEPKKNVIPPEPHLYHKIHLVPFTEYFPFEKLFPTIYTLLLNGDTHMWTPGDEAVVFSAGDLRFGTPICFEDTFGYITRRFARHGAKLFVNMSNDAWAKSVACQYQHLSMSVFRAVETRLSMVRATASGQTAAISPHGNITAMLSPFVEGYICVDIPVFTEKSNTWYVMWGDVLGIIVTIAAVGLLIIGSVRAILNLGKLHEKNR